MGDNDSFEDRLREMAEQLGKRMSEVDIDDLADRYGIDADRARSLADAAGQWLNGQFGGNDPLFGRRGDGPPRPSDPTADLDDQIAHHDPSPWAPDAPPPAGAGDPRDAPRAPNTSTPRGAGPHPLDLPTERQGLALGALDSGRWTVRPGSSRLAASGDGPPPPDADDLVGDLRARDWIKTDGTLTLVGRHALSRWCAAAVEEPGPDA